MRFPGMTKTRSALLPTLPTIPPISEHPEYARQVAVLSVLRNKHGELERNIDRLNLEFWFENRAPREGSSREADAWANLQALRGEQPERQEPPNSDGHPVAVAAALELLRAERPARQPPLREQMERTEADLRVIKAGVAEQQEIVDAIKCDLSLEVRRGLIPQHHEKLRSALNAALALAAAVDAINAEYAELTRLGYLVPWSPDDLIPVPLNTGAFLGSAAYWDSPISHMRRRLEDLGILP